MWKWFSLVIITLSLANCGRQTVDYPIGIDHPPTEQTPPTVSTSDGSSTSESPSNSDNGGVAVASEGVGLNIEIEPVMLRGAITQYGTPDNVNPGS